MEIPRDSIAEPKSVIWPFRLSFITAAISSAVPLQFRNSSSYPATVSIPSLNIRFRPDIASSVNTLCRAAAFWASPMPSVAASTSVRMSVRSRKFPSASWTATVVPLIETAPLSIWAVRSRITARSLVPAVEPFSPWFAIASKREVTVCTSWPAAFRFAAQFL